MSPLTICQLLVEIQIVVGILEFKLIRYKVLVVYIFPKLNFDLTNFFAVLYRSHKKTVCMKPVSLLQVIYVVYQPKVTPLILWLSDFT